MNVCMRVGDRVVCSIHGVNAFDVEVDMMEKHRQDAFVLAKKHIYPIPTINHLKSFVVELRGYVICWCQMLHSMAPSERASDRTRTTDKKHTQSKKITYARITFAVSHVSFTLLE